MEKKFFTIIFLLFSSTFGYTQCIETIGNTVYIKCDGTYDKSSVLSGGANIIVINDGVHATFNSWDTSPWNLQLEVNGEVSINSDVNFSDSGGKKLTINSNGSMNVSGDLTISTSAEIYGELYVGSPCYDCNSCSTGQFTLTNSGSSNIHTYSGSYIEANNVEIGEGVTLEGKMKVYCDFKITNSGGSELTLIEGELEIGRELNIDTWDTSCSDSGGSLSNKISGSGSISVEQTNPPCLKDWLEGKNLLPVELIFFSAKRQSSNVMLTWATASEVNNDYFEIQRSTDGKNFEIIGSVNGNGNSQARIDYEFIDTEAPKSTIYYRLKQVDYNGQFEYYPLIIKSDAARELSILNLSGNPVTGTSLKLQVYSPINQVIWFKLIGQNGMVYYLEEKTVFSGNTLLTIDIGHINPGVVILQAATDDFSQSLKLIRQ
ncbi:hypothetical protein V6R21_24250 [Limibacter armeniacum]|uniref:hypothetical protein n=1 Tax=Limibacter armeniacum TaxID=466084 RepID=UPI002FE507A3